VRFSGTKGVRINKKRTLSLSFVIVIILDLTKTHQQLYFRDKMAFYKKKMQNSFSQKGYNLSSDKIKKK